MASQSTSNYASPGSNRGRPHHLQFGTDSFCDLAKGEPQRVAAVLRLAKTLRPLRNADWCTKLVANLAPVLAYAPPDVQADLALLRNAWGGQRGSQDEQQVGNAW